MQRGGCNSRLQYRNLCVLLTLATLVLTGCSRSVRPQAAKVAAAGELTAEQAASYYETLAKDTIDVWEMTAFQRGFSGLPETEVTGKLRDAYRERYLALLARKRFAETVASTYSEFVNLAAYDSSAEILASVDKLNAAAEGLRGRPLTSPKPADQAISSSSVIEALVTELQTVAENKAILRDNDRLTGLAEKVKAVFDTELPVYKSIADDKRRVYTEVAQSLVKGKAVDSTALVNRVLGAYELKWPSPSTPFNDPNLISAIVEVIDARATPISQMSSDAGDKLSGAFARLISLHRGVVEGDPLSFKEMAQQNAIVQDLLDAIKAKTNLDVLNVIALAEKK